MLETDPNITRIYKYVKIDEGSLRIITDFTLKFSSPSEFNDPLDCMPVIEDSPNLHEVARNKKDLRKQLNDQRGNSPAKRIENKLKDVRELQKNIRETSKSESRTVNGLGICCFTSKPNNILLWSHYGDSHRGMVIGFDVKFPKNYVTTPPSRRLALGTENLIGHNVEYASQRPVFHYGIDDNNTLLTKFALTKAKLWAYEEEIRVIEHDRGAGIFSFQPHCIKEVITGVKTPLPVIEHLSSLVEKANRDPLVKIQFKQAAISETNFEVVIT